MEQTAVVRPLRSEHPSAPLPVGTVTFLLADIEGSVRLWEADRASMTVAIRRLDVLIDEVVTGNSGVRPVEQGEGDSFVAAFSRATDAIGCALALQRVVADEPWPGGLALRIRMAAHTGEAQLRDEGNYVGNAINRAGRLRSLAHGGQVLVSSTTFELAADRLPESAGLRDLGLQRIRDLARPLRVFQLVHPAIPDSYPPLRTLEVLTQSLPNPLSSFIGRERELADIEESLSTTRLLTLTGTGGCGKTRLAIECVRSVADRYPGGMWFVDLASVDDPTVVPAAFAAVLGREEEPDRSMLETIIDHLTGRQALVVVDNCEHLLDAASQLIEEVLAACPTLTILATSREPLHVAGENAWRVPSMATPGESFDQPVDTYDSVRLFIDRAVQARANFAVDNDTAPAVAAICQQLDGIPLAIELAAARVRSLSPDQIAIGLSDRFKLLRGGARSALPRQQTLSASVAWSHDLLSEAERALLHRLSIFRGGFTLDAAEVVTATDGIDSYEVLDLLDSCVDKSLVVVRDEGWAVRYRLLETIREFASDRLIESGQDEAMGDRHALWCADLTASAEQHLYAGPLQVAWLDRLGNEVDNVRAALEWCVARPDVGTGSRILLSSTWFFNVRCHWHEFARWGDKLIAACTPADALAQGRLTWSTESIRGMIGDVDGVLAMMPETARLAEERGDHRVAAWSFGSLAKYSFGSDPTLALAWIESALSAAEKADDPTLLGDVCSVYGWLLFELGETARAEELATRGLAVAENAEDDRYHRSQLDTASCGCRLAELVTTQLLLISIGRSITPRRSVTTSCSGRDC